MAGTVTRTGGYGRRINQHTMRIVAFIEEDAIIQKILKHLGLWETRAHSPPPSYAYDETIYVDEPASSLSM